ncbi:MAG: hypothetical protein SPI53_03980 [Erysipelotrichaceae bacterium]|nr:hypothetical protein [Erysipelotrichaceae bacterium]
MEKLIEFLEGHSLLLLLILVGGLVIGAVMGILNIVRIAFLFVFAIIVIVTLINHFVGRKK